MTTEGADWVEVAPVLRAQRHMARLSLRTLAGLTGVSDSYLSQVERGLHQPSPEVLKAMAVALGFPVRQLYERLGWLDGSGPAEPDASLGVALAVERDPRLTPSQKAALLSMYRALLGE